MDGEVVSSTFDGAGEPFKGGRYGGRAQRLVESRKDVVILLDSITRLARTNNVVPQRAGLFPVVLISALRKPKRFRFRSKHRRRRQPNHYSHSFGGDRQSNG